MSQENMSQEQNPNTPKANNNTATTATIEHISSPLPTSTQDGPAPVSSGRLSPSQQHSDPPRRASSLRHSSPGQKSPVTMNASVQLRSDGGGGDGGGGGGKGQAGDEHVNDEEEGLQGTGNGDISGRNNMDNAKEQLEEFDWEGLEERFWERMEECRRVEEGIVREFEELVEVGFSSEIFFLEGVV